MGLGVGNGWIAANPQLLGYNGVVGYLPAKRGGRGGVRHPGARGQA